jgi:hypothetical protein
MQDNSLQENSFYIVGAAFSRKYLISTMLPPFIAAESRSHNGRITQLKLKMSLLQ